MLKANAKHNRCRIKKRGFAREKCTTLRGRQIWGVGFAPPSERGPNLVFRPWKASALESNKDNCHPQQKGGRDALMTPKLSTMSQVFHDSAGCCSIFFLLPIFPVLKTTNFTFSATVCFPVPWTTSVLLLHSFPFSDFPVLSPSFQKQPTSA